MQLRRFFVLVLALCLLCGCTPAPSDDLVSDAPSVTPSQPTEPTTPPTDPPTAPTEPPTQPTEPPVFGTAVSGTDGALRAQPLDIGIYSNARLWGDTMLFYNANRCQIRSLKDGSLLAEAPGIDANLVTLTDDYIIYFIYAKHQIVFRDKNLETVQIIEASVNHDAGEMVFTQDGKTGYYTDVFHIVEHDVQTDEERWIPVEDTEIWGVTGLHFNESILSYWGKENGKEYTAFVDLKTGKYLGKDYTITRFQSWDNGYYLCRAENGNVENLVVTDATERYIQVRSYEDLHYSTWALPQSNSLLVLRSGYECSDILLELYDFATGECTAILPVDLDTPYQSGTDAFLDPSGEFIWLCLKVGTPKNYQAVLYRWDYKANALTSPIDSSVAVPAGTPLIGDELAALQDLFTWPSHYTVMSYANFSTPAERSLQELLREGPETESFEMSEAERAYLSAISEGFILLDTYRISKDDVIRILDQYYGLTLEDFPDLGAMVYWEETDYFYYYHSDTARRNLTVTHAVALADGTVWIRYSGRSPDNNTGEMILNPTQDGYQILSNQTSPP